MKTKPRLSISKSVLVSIGCLVVFLCLLPACDSQQIKSGTTNKPSTIGKKISVQEMEGLARAMDQIVYVPVYSHIYHSQGAPLSLTATLSIRNTDLEASIIVTAVDYFDSAGKLVRKYMDAPLILPALSSLEYVVGEQENTGGAGANFIVEWFAQTEVFEPIIESVMIGTKSQQGISFISVGKVVSKK